MSDLDELAEYRAIFDRARALLRSHITETQWRQLVRYGSFALETPRPWGPLTKYWIGPVFVEVRLLGWTVARYCIQPSMDDDYCPLADAILARKLLVEGDRPLFKYLARPWIVPTLPMTIACGAMIPFIGGTVWHFLRSDIGYVIGAGVACVAAWVLMYYEQRGMNQRFLQMLRRGKVT